MCDDDGSGDDVDVDAADDEVVVVVVVVHDDLCARVCAKLIGLCSCGKCMGGGGASDRSSDTPRPCAICVSISMAQGWMARGHVPV
jgi:hypothetical protein